MISVYLVHPFFGSTLLKCKEYVKKRLTFCLKSDLFCFVGCSRYFLNKALEKGSNLIYNTSSTHERHKCDTSDMNATRVRHQRHDSNTGETRAAQVRHKFDTSATRTTRVRHECDTSDKF